MRRPGERGLPRVRNWFSVYARERGFANGCGRRPEKFQAASSLVKNITIIDMLRCCLKIVIKSKLL